MVLNTTTSSVSAEMATAATTNPSHIGGADGRTSNDSMPYGPRVVTTLNNSKDCQPTVHGLAGRWDGCQVALAVIRNGRQRRRHTPGNPRLFSSWTPAPTPG